MRGTLPRWMALALALGGYLWAVVHERYSPPAVHGAAAEQRSVFAGVPRPAGSAADLAGRKAIEAELTRLGIPFEEVPGEACNARRFCARITNLVARIEGSEPGKAVMVTSHQDSVPAGPGMSDDGAGVDAALEVARALEAGPPPRHSVVLAFTDAEELWLVGAYGLVAQGRLKDVAAVVNLEARGTDGPVLMFESGVPDGGWIDVYASAVDHPITNSLAATVYRMLPNDTDFTVFRGAGVGGFNLAFIGGAARYHTPRDDLAHRDVRSVAQMKTHAVALVRALANGPLPPESTHDAVFFDLLGYDVVRLPVGWMPVLAIAALLLIGFAVVHELRTRRLEPRTLMLGVGGAMASLVAALLLGTTLTFVLQLTGRLDTPWLAHPGPFHAAFAVAGVLGAWSATWLISARFGANASWAGLWVLVSLLGVWAAFSAPALSYPLVFPALLAGAAMLVPGSVERAMRLSVLLGFTGFGVLLLPLDVLLPTAMGVVSFPACSILWGLWATSLAPYAIALVGAAAGPHFRAALATADAGGERTQTGAVVVPFRRAGAVRIPSAAEAPAAWAPGPEETGRPGEPGAETSRPQPRTGQEAQLLLGGRALRSWAARRANRVLTIALAVAVVVLLGIGLALPQVTPDNPRPLNLTHLVDAETGKAKLLLEQEGRSVPAPFASAALFSAREESPYPWNPERTAYVAPAPEVHLGGPTLESRPRGPGVVELTFTPRPGTLFGGLMLPAERVRSLHWNGVLVPPGRAPRDHFADPFIGEGWFDVRGAVGDRGKAEIIVELEGDGPVHGLAWDASSGLGPTLETVARARPADTTDIQWGDLTLVTRPITIPGVGLP